MAYDTISDRSLGSQLSGHFAESQWHTVSAQQAVRLLESDLRGLSDSEAERRQETYGPNELTEKTGRSRWIIFRDQFTNIMLLMLMAVAVVSAVLDFQAQHFPKDAIAISTVVLLNGILGYAQESKAEQALTALKRLSSPKVRVLRLGKLQEIDAKALVPGDIVHLEAGAQVAADGRLLEAVSLQVKEAALTGEAVATLKQAGTELPEEAPLGDRLNMVFQGTEVLHGRGQMIVTATGMQSELGHIAALLQGVEAELTPLQKRMTQLGNVLVGGSLVLVALVVLGGVWTLGWDQFASLLEVSLSMAVAVVPESLPAVITVTLALGMQRMVRRHALIRKLPAVETLGSVTVICSDKTGTLTQNKMVVQALYTGSHTIQVTGDGYAPEGDFSQVEMLGDPPTALSPDAFPAELQGLLIASVVCNDAVLQTEQDDWVVLGDPTEGALLALAAKGHYLQHQWHQWLPRVHEFPFSSERKRMSVICQNKIVDRAQFALLAEAPYFVFTKGSPEAILERCSQQQTALAVEALSTATRSQILVKNEQIASQGLRVLGLAYKPLPSGADVPESEAEQDLIWLGLVGMMDPPRLAVSQAVSRCRTAGIRPVMITGDHPLTASAIAQEVGILQPGDRVVTGSELDRMAPHQLKSEVGDIGVYARVTPEHKLRIVQAWQQQGQVVAMTGDGVNDAPALKQADIGLAMGITGTDVSKEAADMVLTDDNFASIVAATEEGRIVYDNIRRFIKYVLGSNIGEVITIAATPLLGLAGVPLSPLQILWMNLVTDGLPALALALEKAEPNVMQRPPHSPKESIFARGLGLYMIRVGLVLSVVSIGLMLWAYGHTHQAGYERNPDTWKTMVFTTLCLAQMGHAWAVRSQTRLTIELNPLSNPFLLWAVLATSGLQLLLIYVPVLRSFFDTYWLSPTELLVCFGFSALVFVWLEAEKLFIRFVVHK
ncbi:MAG: cation-transporting P-type ATPase [Phormidesmis sp.]